MGRRRSTASLPSERVDDAARPIPWPWRIGVAVLCLATLPIGARPTPDASAPESVAAPVFDEPATLTLSFSGDSGDEAPPPVVVWATLEGERVAEVSGPLPLSLSLPREVPVTVVAEAPGRARFAQSIVLQGDRELRVPLPEGATVRGVVVDDLGAAVEGAQIQLEREDGAAPLPWTATSDGEGRFAIDTLWTGAHRLAVRASGHARIARAGVDPSDEALRLTLERVGLVAGRVMRPDGDPAPGAEVVIAGSGLWPARRAHTDADGRFRFPEVPPGVYEVRAFAGEQVAEPRRGLLVEAGGRSLLTFALQDGVRLSGIVRDADTREGVEGAEITVATEALDAAPRVATSGEGGRFLVSGLPAGVVQTVSVFAEGYVPVTAVEHGPGEPLEVSLVRGAVLAGVVLDADRRPVPNATVEVLGEDEARQPISLGAGRGFRSAVFGAHEAQTTQTQAGPAPMALEVTGGPVPPIPVAPMGASGATELAFAPLPETALEHRYADAHRTDEFGRFRITGVPPGHVQVLARRPDLAPASTPRLFVAAGGERDDIELILPPAGRLVGRVLDDRGRGLDGILVEVRSDALPHPRVTFSDARGRFELDGVVGELTVTALPHGRPAARARAEVISGEETEVELALEEALHTLAGRAVDAGGFPLAGVQLTVSSLRADAPHRRTLWSGDDGTFSLPGLPAPPWRLEALQPGFAPARLDLFEPADDVRVTLDRGAEISGSLLDDRTGEPVQARVELLRDDLPPERLATRTDADGAFRFERARAGLWTLRVTSEDHLPHEADFRLEARGGQPRDRALRPIRLTPGSRLEGTVVDALGAPVARATVRVDDHAATTDGEGHYVLRGLSPGEVVAVASHPAAGEAETDATRLYEGRETLGVVIHLPERFDAARAAEMPGRRRGVAVEVRRVDGEIRVREVREDSGAARAGLRAGDVLLEIDGDAPRTALQALRLLAGSPSVPAVIWVRRGEREATLVVEREVWLP